MPTSAFVQRGQFCLTPDVIAQGHAIGCGGLILMLRNHCLQICVQNANVQEMADDDALRLSAASSHGCLGLGSVT